MSDYDYDKDDNEEISDEEVEENESTSGYQSQEENNNQDDDDEFEPYNPALFENSNGNSNNSNNTITTEGLHLQEVSHAQKNLVSQCIICNKFYAADMLIPADKGEERNCYHCFFWMNYSLDTRRQVDGLYGMTIVDYILKCKDIHAMDTCTHKSDNGGCYLCEFNLGIPIEDVKDVERLYNSHTNSYTTEEEYDGITVDI